MKREKFRPSRLVHRGTVLAAGFLFYAEQLSKKEMRRRVLTLWQPGATVYRLEQNLFLRFNAPQQVDCRAALGLPLVLQGKHFCAFPVSAKQSKIFEDYREAVIFLQAGDLKISELATGKIELLENWFDVADFTILTVEPLGEIKLKPVALTTIAETNLKLRDELKGIPQADKEMSEILQLLRRAKEEKQQQIFNNQVAAGGVQQTGGGNLWGSGFSALKSIWSDFSRLWKQNEAQTSFAPPTKQRTGGYSMQPVDAEPDWSQRLTNQLRHLWVKAMVKFRVAQLIGRQQAEYLHKMMNLFEQGELQEALRYAIPLEDVQALTNMKNRFAPAPFLGFLRPRSGLNISPQQGYSSSSVNLEAEWFEHLRKLYRASFERLEAQGRIEEAAFVLAELLRDNQQAVAFLEKHEKFVLAAELAEARGLPKATVVRQWFIAGERERAVRLAILYNCFDYVVTEFEKAGKKEGAELREIWADTLAEGGNYAAAVNVVWSLAAKREKAADWIEIVIEQGGSPAARMLALKTSLLPQKFAEIKEQAAPLLAEDTRTAAEHRALFARELSKLAPNDETRTLARAAIRSVLRDAQEGVSSLTKREFDALVQVSGNNTLRTDLPPFPQNRQSTDFRQKLTKEWQRTDGSALEIHISAADKGASAIFDAVVFPNGRIALALGEAGIKILNRDGKQLVHFDQPTEKFVLSDNAARAISLIRRGEVWRLAKVDFVARQVESWCDAQISAFAPDYNGNLWFIGVKDEFYAVDATAKDFAAAWRVGDVGGQVLNVARSETLYKFLTATPNGLEKWTYQMPNLYLRGRGQITLPEQKTEQILLHSEVSVGAYSILVSFTLNGQPQFRASIFDHERLIEEFELPADTIKCDAPQILGSCFVLTYYTADAARVNVYEIEQGIVSSIVLAAVQTASTKLDENTVTIADDCGRLLVLDYKNQILQQNLRL